MTEETHNKTVDNTKQARAIQSDPRFNVTVTRFLLESNPASITIYVDIAGENFFSKITYHSIPSWNALWNKFETSLCKSQLIGALIAWDCMRFMALGGETLTLCDDVYLDEKTQELWRTCFRRQFGEWRYRNQFSYRAHSYPLLQNNAATLNQVPKLSDEVGRGIPGNRILLTNGGGKDSLVGMILMKDAKLSFDIYEGSLPIGGSSIVQESLLSNLRDAAAPSSNQLIKVSIQDNFFSTTHEDFARIGVTTKHYKSDFSVGHTANYPGYFPLVLYHEYKGVWFNIEESADRGMVQWGEESINHQWCKTQEYQKLSTDLFANITGVRGFDGFSSTLRGLSDSSIYAIAATEEDLLRKTHSCNIDKPWCQKCTKCCFSYLMLCAFKDEDYAKEVIGATQSLFDMQENIRNWQDLLNTNHVAWECVPSHEECLVAVATCLKKGIRHAVLVEYATQADAAAITSGNKYAEVKWIKLPTKLIEPTFSRLGQGDTSLECDVVIIGAGQSGLSASYTLKQSGINHLVIEANTIGSSWQNRWDSFRLNTPNRTLALPGMRYAGSNPDGFSTKEDVINFLSSYAEKFQLPVACNNRVISVKREGKKFFITTETSRIFAKSIVIATGEYSSPRKPLIDGGFSPEIDQVHSRDYRNAMLLKQGAILVVGGGQSGAQITEDLLATGREVYWSLSDRPSNTRRIYGKDFMEWWEIGGIMHRHIDDDPDVLSGKPGALQKARSTEFPLVSGNGGNGFGHSISLKTLSEAGVVLLGKLRSVNKEGVAEFKAIREQIERAISGTRNEYEKLLRIASKFYGKKNICSISKGEFTPPEVTDNWLVPDAPTQINLKTAGISTVIYATGFRSEWPWLEVENLFDEFSYPLGHDGVSPEEGIFFVGLFNLQRLSSTCLCNQGKDAEALLPYIKNHLLKLGR